MRERSVRGTDEILEYLDEWAGGVDASNLRTYVILGFIVVEVFFQFQAS